MTENAGLSHLVHAGLIEPHDGGMGQPVKHRPQRLLRIKLLWLEKLFKELFVEHGGNDVIHNYKGKQQRPSINKLDQLHISYAQEQTSLFKYIKLFSVCNFQLVALISSVMIELFPIMSYAKETS